MLKKLTWTIYSSYHAWFYSHLTLVTHTKSTQSFPHYKFYMFYPLTHKYISNKSPWLEWHWLSRAYFVPCSFALFRPGLIWFEMAYTEPLNIRQYDWGIANILFLLVKKSECLELPFSHRTQYSGLPKIE